jgi:hypothetical protein
MRYSRSENYLLMAADFFFHGAPHLISDSEGVGIRLARVCWWASHSVEPTLQVGSARFPCAACTDDFVGWGRVPARRDEAHQPTQTIVTLSRGGMIGEGNFGLRL